MAFSDEDRRSLKANDGGRCSALRVENFTLNLLAVDCNEKRFTPLCERNLARNCVPVTGEYEGRVAVTRSGIHEETVFGFVRRGE